MILDVKLDIRINVAAPRAQASSEKSPMSECVLHSRIKWNKCDLSLYKSVVSESLSRGFPEVECTLDAELTVRLNIAVFSEKTDVPHLPNQSIVAISVMKL